MKVSIVFTSSGASQTVAQTQQIQQALGQVGSAASRVEQQSKSAGTSVADLAFKFNNVVSAVQNLAAAAKPAYDLLIGQNEKLNQQLLGARANLVATNKILKDGVEIKDSTEAIKALDAPVKEAVQQIRLASLDVVGVTSSQLIEVFNILTSQAASLNQQSKELPNSIDAAAKLTTDFSAALGTIGLPLGLARQEINSILSGMIDQNSVLAKQLGITNQQVAEWKAQGVLVDELRKRLEPFVEGNKLAARSISGITSNIQEVLEITAQAAGEPLLEPLVNSLDELYQFLKENQKELQNFSQDAVLKFLGIAQAVGDAALRIGDVLLPAIQDLQPSAEIFADTFVTGLKVSADGVANLVEVLQPLIQGLVDLTNIATEGFEQAQNNLAELAGTAQLSQEAIQSYAGVTETLIGQATKSIKEQKVALDLRNQADKDKIQLTKEQVEAETNARKSAQQVLTDLKNQRKELVQLSVVGTENKIALKGQIRDLDTYINTLERQSKGFKSSITNIQVQAKSLDTLGNTYKQLQDKAENTKRVLAEGAGGDSNRANQAAKELISLTEQRRQLGQISAAEATKQLETVRTNTKISFDQQQAAAEAITKIRKGEGDRQVADIKTQQQQVQLLIDGGQISQAEGERRLTSLKQKELEQRLQITREAIAREKKEGRGNGDTAKELVQQERQIQAELLGAKSQGLKQQLSLLVQNFDEQKTQLEAAHAERLISEEEFNQESLKLTLKRLDEELRQVNLQRSKLSASDKEGLEALATKEAEIRIKRAKAIEDGEKKSQEIQLKALEKTLAESDNAVKLSENTRLQQIQELLNKGVITQQKAEQMRVDAKRQSIVQEIELEQQKLAKLQSLPQLKDPEQEEARQVKIRASQKQTADLQLQLLQNEYDQQQKVKEAAIKAIEERLGAQTRASNDAIASLNQEKAAYEAIEKSIDSSLKLLESRASVQRALTNLQQSERQIELNGVQKALEIQREIDKTQSPEAKILLQKALNELGIDGANTELDLIKKKQELEDELASQKREATALEQERQRQSLALELQKNKLAADRALIEAKIAENQAKQNLISAQGNLAKAQQNPSDQEAIKNAQQAVNLAGQSVDLASQNTLASQAQVNQQQELAANAKAVLEANQKAEIAQLDFADKTREASQAMELAQIEVDKFAETMKRAEEASRAAAEAKKAVESTPTPTSRFTGGPMSAGQPYLVGDGPGGQVIPGVSEIIVPGTNSYAVSARKVAELMSPPSTSMAISSTPASGDRQLIKEIQGLREDLRTRKPINNNQFTFNREGDEMGQLYQVMDMIRSTMPL